MIMAQLETESGILITLMEGFYRDGKDGMTERPGDNESTVTWQGRPLPYLPYAYRHPEYWKKIQEESKAGDTV